MHIHSHMNEKHASVLWNHISDSYETLYARMNEWVVTNQHVKAN